MKQKVVKFMGLEMKLKTYYIVQAFILVTMVLLAGICYLGLGHRPGIERFAWLVPAGIAALEIFETLIVTKTMVQEKD